MAESTCPKPDCIDTPLVSTASITGIMTFIYAVLVGMLLAWIEINTIDSEITEIVLAFESTDRQLKACRHKMTYLNEVLPKGSTRQELYHLYGILKRGEDIVNDPQTRKIMDKVSIFGHFNKFKRLGSLMAGRAMKDTMHGKLKAAQRVLSEIQLGLISLKQDIINADQIARSNALLNMMLDSSKRPSVDEIQRSATLFSAAQNENSRPNGDDRSPPDSSDLDYPFDQRASMNGSEREKSTTQIRSDEVRRSFPVNESASTVDPLGTLMRARTMSIVPGDVGSGR